MSDWEMAHMDWTSPGDLAFWFFKSGAFEHWMLFATISVGIAIGYVAHKVQS